MMSSKCCLFLLFLEVLHALGDKCDNFKYKYPHPYMSDVCISCTICPHDVRNDKDYRVDAVCKSKNDEMIPGQGHAWCTGVTYQHPQCREWQVPHGTLKCRDNHTRSVYTKCKVICDEGYTIQNESIVECMENLIWDKRLQDRPSCKRTDSPTTPKLESVGGLSVFNSGSTVSLKCLRTSDTVGETFFFFYKDQKELPHDSKNSTYVIHRATTKDHSGTYYCSVQDNIGRSKFSSNLFIDVRPAEPSHEDDRKTSLLMIMVIVLVAAIVLISLAFCLRKKKCRRDRDKGKQNYISSDSSILTASSCSTTQVLMGPDVGASNTACNGRDLNRSEICIVGINEISEVAMAYRNTAQLQAEEHEVQRSEVNAVRSQLLQAGGAEHRDEDNSACSGTIQQPPLQAEKGLVQASERDAKALCSLCNDQTLMKKVVEHLDQQKDKNRDKPTFYDLGRYLKMTNDKINHIEFKYRQDQLKGPTQIMLYHMKAYGYGLGDLIDFLVKFTDQGTKDLTTEIKQFQSLCNAKNA